MYNWNFVEFDFKQPILTHLPFTGYHNFWPSDLDLEVSPAFQKLRPWPEFLNKKREGFHIWHVYSLRQDLSHRIKVCDLVTLKLMLFLGYDFWIKKVIFCCYLHMVASVELWYLSVNTGLVLFYIVFVFTDFRTSASLEQWESRECESWKSPS